MEIITAQQAAELAKLKEPEINAARELEVQKTLQDISKKVRDAATKGDRSMVYDFTYVKHRDIVIDYLRAEPYLFKVNNHIRIGDWRLDKCRTANGQYWRQPRIM